MMYELRNKSKLRFFYHEIVENLILGKHQEKKSRKIRGSRDNTVLPGALFFGKTFFFIFSKTMMF